MTRTTHGEAYVLRTSQLVTLAREALSDALRIDCDDERFDEIEILNVEPRRGTRRLLVVFGPTKYRPPGAGGREETLAAFVNAKGFLRYALAAALSLKRVPDLTFVAEPARWSAWETRHASDDPA